MADVRTPKNKTQREYDKAVREASQRKASKYDQSAEAELARERGKYLPGQRRALRQQRA